MDAAAVSLEGKALTWFQWLETQAPVKTWQEFKREVTDRFHSLQQGDEYEQLMGLRQESTVEEFRERFELLSASLESVQEEVLMGAFKNGIKEEIRAEVRLMQPSSLKQLMNFALQVESKNSVLQRVQEEKRSKAPKTIGPVGSGRWPKFKTIAPTPKISFTEAPRSVSFPSSVAPTNTHAMHSEEPKNAASKVSASISPTPSSGSSATPRQWLFDAEMNR